MGLISELDYEVKDASAIQRVTHKVAASGPGAWVFQRTMYPIDKGLCRLTKRRLTVPGLMAGLPVIMMTTTGAKTGKDRTMPLLGIPMDDDLAVIESNSGQRSTPGWVYNLRAELEATAEFGSESVAVTALMGHGRNHRRTRTIPRPAHCVTQNVEQRSQPGAASQPRCGATESCRPADDSAPLSTAAGIGRSDVRVRVVDGPVTTRR